jgi:hypothetical protein
LVSRHTEQVGEIALLGYAGPATWVAITFSISMVWTMKQHGSYLKNEHNISVDDTR